ncbi:Natural resistance-associated macrophage protein [Acididesulfobacillus acetoxydans]|uniref:Natural resistance-associated macrophage protein n=1 Tax=Acididesulfobacillus acetoxydans TaxID=1561005 RepID=A0A8S0VW48_9FIRM|nr:NRAMP family divalent metal transporter [Acididesulfobacillus acetoxydans]CAA7600423.1 Natural resistance-associated macrophage protein [Acididesulfobacillus acetoxydans]CEJ06557.1 Natural resistance-associated macrophage protein [Acididesulfobacillus acetoxydans]
MGQEICAPRRDAEAGRAEADEPTKRPRWLLLLATLGPGITVMLADTDAGSMITAAQSGARWGYRLLLLQLLLIPILYFIQELTTRIGIVTHQGHGELIRAQFGPKWAWFSVATLFVSAVGALVTEFAGIAGAGLVFGIPPLLSVSSAAALLILITAMGRYSFVERTAILIGLFELVFLPGIFFAHPDPSVIVRQLTGGQPLYDKTYWLLIAANVGAVIMPWMVFYQQGAVVDKGLRPSNLKFSRLDTAVGSVVTQIIMGAVLILTAATIGRVAPNSSLANVQEIAHSLTPFLGQGGKILFAVGITGAALIAAIVVSLAASWAFGEVLGFRCSLNNTWKEAPVFYGLYSGGIVFAAFLVLLGIPLISLTVAVEVMNALLLPIVVGFLLALGWRVLPQPYRLKLWEKIVLIFIYLLICSLGFYTLFQLI